MENSCKGNHGHFDVSNPYMKASGIGSPILLGQLLSHLDAAQSLCEGMRKYLL